MDVDEYFANMTEREPAGGKFWEKQCFTQISREFESHRLINGFRERNSLIWHEETVCSETAKTFFSSAHQQFLPLIYAVSGYWAILHIYVRTWRLWRKAFSQRNAIHDSRPRSSWSIIEATRAFSNSIRINAGTFVVEKFNSHGMNSLNIFSSRTAVRLAACPFANVDTWSWHTDSREENQGPGLRRMFVFFKTQSCNNK